MHRFWVPSVTESAIFGTRMADDWFAVGTGGDLAFLNGVLKVLLAEGWINRSFVRDRTDGLEEVRGAPEGSGLLSREELDADSREPDYNALVWLERLSGRPSGLGAAED